MPSQIKYFGSVSFIPFFSFVSHCDGIDDDHNNRGLFSSSLAEHVVLSCLYFAKDVDRWKRNQRERKWDQFCVTEVRSS